MRPDELRAHLKKHPFRPFRVFVSDGSHYDVLDPDFMLVTKSEVTIAISLAGEEMPDRSAYLDPVHITRVEPINGA